MNNRLYYILLFLIAFLTTGCSDEPFGSDPVDFDAPEICFMSGDMPAMITRGDIEQTVDENHVEDVWIGIYADGILRYHTLKEIKGVPGNQKYTVRILLNSFMKSMKTGSLYLIANRTSLIENENGDFPMKETDLVKILDDIPLGEGSDICMWTKKELSTYKDIAQNSNNEKELYHLKRNRAKVTMRGDVEQKLVPERIYLLNCLERSYVCATGVPVDTDDDYDYTWVSTTGPEGEVIYPFPVKNGNPILIFEIKESSGADGYYRAAFIADESSDIIGNHHYQVEITDVDGSPFPSLRAAILGDDNLKIKIYDRTPVIYNMITDGKNELGVSDTIVYDGRDDFYEMYVKVASKDKENIAKITAKAADEDSDWISVMTDDNSPKLTEVLEDGELTEAVWRYNIRINSQEDGVTRIGHIKIEWDDRLSREVAVVKKRIFDSAVLNVSMTSSQTGAPLIENYLEFVKGGSPSQTYSHEVAYGVRPEQNLGQVRNEGFHFPIGLKTSHDAGAQFAEFSYILSAPTGKTIEKIEFGGNASYFKKNINISRQGSDAWKLSWSGSNDYEYMIAPEGLVVTVKDSSGAERKYLFDLYHTGFLWYDANSEKYDKSGRVKTGWYYYEVETIHDGSHTHHWLDRNIGASAAGIFIENADGSSYLGQDSEESPYKLKEESRGGLYCAAEYVGGGEYRMVSDICPPGFRVPLAKEWNCLTGADCFDNALELEAGHSFWNSLFVGSGKRVYFPKQRYISPETNSIAGNEKTGYYWTATPAVGTSSSLSEKGYWLQVIKFAGSKPSFDRLRYRPKSEIVSDISESEIKPAYGSGNLCMNVRCIENSTNENTLEKLNFAVKGYTHIWLYVDNNGVRTPLNNWPGDRITMPQQFNENSPYFEISFETYLDLDKEIYVVLNNVDANGRIIACWCEDGRNIDVSRVAPDPESVRGYRQEIVLDADGSHNSAVFYKYPDKTTVIPSLGEITESVVFYDHDNGSFKDTAPNHVHSWGGSANMEWPGRPLEKVDGFDYLYKGTIILEGNNLIFNDYYGASTVWQTPGSFSVVNNGVYCYLGLIDTFDNYINNRHPYYVRGLNYKWSSTKSMADMDEVKLTKVEEGLYKLNNITITGSGSFKIAHITWNSGPQYAHVDGSNEITPDTPYSKIGEVGDGNDMAYSGLSGVYNIIVDLRDPEYRYIYFDKPLIKMAKLNWDPGLRGSFNSWGYQAMTYNEEVGRYEALVDFGDYSTFSEYLNGSLNDDQSNPRFLIASDTWGNKFGANSDGGNVNGRIKVAKLKNSGEDIGAKIKGLYWVYLEQMEDASVRVRLEKADTRTKANRSRRNK